MCVRLCVPTGVIAGLLYRMEIRKKEALGRGGARRGPKKKSEDLFLLAFHALLVDDGIRFEKLN